MKQRLLYESYQARSGPVAQSTSNVMRDRARNAALLVLLAAVIVLAILGGRAMYFRSETEELFVGTMRTECESAISLTSQLSRTAGASSSGILGRIRSHVHAMDVINQFNVALHGGDQYLVPPDIFTGLYSLIETYTDKLRTGMVTGDLQTELMAELTALSALVNEL